MPFKRKLMIAVILALVAGGLIYGFYPGAIEVDTSEVTMGPMAVTVEEEGKTAVKERFVISAPVAGYLRRIVFEVGDQVSKGQTVAELEPLRSEVLDPRSRAAARAEVSAAKASLGSAEENARARRAQYEFARKELERTRSLFEAGYAAKSVMDRVESGAKEAEAALRSAEAAARSAEAAVRKAETALGYSPSEDGRPAGRVIKVRSPVEGRVLKLRHESEGAVPSGERLMDIGDTASLEVRSEVLSVDAVKISPMAAVLIERWGGESVLEGRVRVVEPTAFTKVSALGVEEQRVVVISEIISPPESWQRLGDGYRVEAKFIVWKSEKVLRVPTSAIFRAGEENAVFVVKEGKACERPVKIGQRNGLTAEVLSGLSAGDDVITHPDSEIKDGARVKRRMDSAQIQD